MKQMRYSTKQSISIRYEAMITNLGLGLLTQIIKNYKPRANTDTYKPRSGDV